MHKNVKELMEIGGNRPPFVDLHIVNIVYDLNYGCRERERENEEC